MTLHPYTKPFRQFVREARKVHGQTYSYVESTYKGARTPMTIVCPRHGNFKQAPEAHLRGQRCRNCYKEAETNRIREVSLQRLKDALLERSGGTVTVDEKTFKALNKSARFICEKHKSFRKRAFDCLVQLHPCTECGRGQRDNRYSNAEAYAIMRERVPRGYRVIPFKYEGRQTLVTIDCKKHAPYTVKFGSSSRGVKCLKCSHTAAMAKRKASIKKSNENKRSEYFDDWLQRARERHGDKFDYSRVKYQTMKSVVLIGCPYHGFRRQLAETHLKGGCKQCAVEELGGRYTEKFFELFPERRTLPAHLYYVRIAISEEVFYKVGITVNSVKTRFSAAFKGATIEVLSTLKTTLYRAFALETELQRSHGDRHRFRPALDSETIRKLRIGPSECFSAPLSSRKFKKLFNQPN